MKFQNPSLNSVLTGRTDGRTDKRTSRNQYAPNFFKVGGINTVCLIGCLDYAVVPNQDRYWFGPSV